MMYMYLLNWEPEERDAVIERARKIGLDHEGMKVIGTWSDVAGGRCFQLCDVPDDIDPALILKANFAWNDIMEIERVPVMDATVMMNMTENLKQQMAAVH